MQIFLNSFFRFTATFVKRSRVVLEINYKWDQSIGSGEGVNPMASTLERLASALGTRLRGTGFERITYYDLVLGVIPAAFALAVLVGHALSLPVQNVVAAASLFAGLAVVDALFLNPPTTSG